MLLVFAIGTAESPAASFATIVTNGPATNRVNLVFFSEGYTNGQLGKFLTDTTNAANFFLHAEPYAEYSSFFNVFAIFTNSAHVGSTHLIGTTYKAGFTYFNSTYDGSSDYIITIPPNSSDNKTSDGQGKIDALLKMYLPGTNNDLPVLLVNDLTAGGSDNYGTTAISSVPNVSYILVHESGHTLGKLGDEYTTPYTNFPNVEQPNTTTNTVLSQIQWSAWIETNTPIPTPFLETYADAVGLFEGAHYHATGWYRPYENCCMQSFGVGFCPVCQEALVLAIYGKARPLDSCSPATNSLTVTSPQLLAFSLKVLQPATHSLNIRWLTNGIAVADATNQVLNLWPVQLGNGTNKVEADVWDATSMVRKDAKNLLMQTNLWKLKVTVPILQIDSLSWLTNGSFSFRVTVADATSVVIQQSTNLLQWTSIQTNSLGSGKFYYTNSAAGKDPERFFRVMTPP